MFLVDAKAKNFQGYKNFSIDLGGEAACIVGSNMSGKSTGGRVALWCLTGTFPYPADMVRLTKDMIHPDEWDNLPRSKRKGLATTAEALFFVYSDAGVFSEEHPEGTGDLDQALAPQLTRRYYAVTRHQPLSGKMTLTLRQLSADLSTTEYIFTGAQAQNLIYTLAKIPAHLTPNDRAKMFMRTRWLGVGQETSFFSAKGTERKKILESVNPQRKLSAMYAEASTRLKKAKAEEKTLETEYNRLIGSFTSSLGELAGKNSELVKHLGATAKLGTEFAPSKGVETAVTRLRAESLRVSPVLVAQNEVFQSLPAKAGEADAKDAPALFKTEGKKTVAALQTGDYAAALTSLTVAQQALEQELRRISQGREAAASYSKAATLAAGLESTLTALSASLDGKSFSDYRELRKALADALSHCVALRETFTKKELLGSRIHKAEMETKSTRVLIDGLSKHAVALRQLKSATEPEVATHLDLILSYPLLTTPAPAAADDHSSIFAALGRHDIQMVLEDHDLRATLASVAGEIKASAGSTPQTETPASLDLQQAAQDYQNSVGSIAAALTAVVSEIKRADSESSEKDQANAVIDAIKPKLMSSLALLFSQDDGSIASKLSRLAGSLKGSDLSEADRLAHSIKDWEVLSREIMASLTRYAAVATVGPEVKAAAAVVVKEAAEAISAALIKSSFTESSVTALVQMLTDISAELPKIISGVSLDITKSKEVASTLALLKNDVSVIEASKQKFLNPGNQETMCGECGQEVTPSHRTKHVSTVESNLAKKRVALVLKTEELTAVETEILRKMTTFTEAAQAVEEVLAKTKSLLKEISGPLQAASLQLKTLSSQPKNPGSGAAAANSLGMITALANQAIIDEEKLAAGVELVMDKVLPLASDAEAEAADLLVARLTGRAETLGKRAREFEMTRVAERSAVAAEAAQKKKSLDSRVYALQNTFSKLTPERSARATRAKIEILESELAAAEAAGASDIQTFASSIESDRAKLAALKDEQSSLQDKILSSPMFEGVDPESLSDDEVVSGLRVQVSLIEAEMDRIKETDDLIIKTRQDLQGLKATVSTFEAGNLFDLIQLADAGSLSLREQKTENLAAQLAALSLAFNAYIDAGYLLPDRLYPLEMTIRQIEIKSAEIRGLEDNCRILSPNGEARTLAMTDDILFVTNRTNELLKSLMLEKSLQVNLSLTKDSEDDTPAIDLQFEVDGRGGKTLPSESQRKIVGFAMDLAVIMLGVRDGFLFVDEPETGMDEKNSGKISNFLKELSPQTILITNRAASGLGRVISTKDLHLANDPVFLFGPGSETEDDTDGDSEGGETTSPKKKAKKRRKPSDEILQPETVDSGTL